MWPTDDSTTKSGPSMVAMVRALAGDSTMTRGLPALEDRVRGGMGVGVPGLSGKGAPDRTGATGSPGSRPRGDGGGGLAELAVQGFADLLLGAEALGLALGEGDGREQHNQGAGGDAVAGAVVVARGDDHREDEQRHQVHHLDERVERGSGGVLERVPDGV